MRFPVDKLLFCDILFAMKSRYAIGIFILLLTVLPGCAGRPALPDFSSLSGIREERLTPVQKEILRTARSLLGTPYKFGGTTPEGFDCSGYINYVYHNAAGVRLPRMTQDLSQAGKSVSVSDLQPADLVAFKIERQKPLHIGIYIGDGKFIHAPSSKGKVNIQRLNLDYWRTRYLGARRVL